MSLEEESDWLIEVFNRNDVNEIPVDVLHPILSYQTLLELTTKYDFLELGLDKSSGILLLCYTWDEKK